MKIGFFHIDTDKPSCDDFRRCARGMVRSAKRAMPTVEIVQFTDLTTKPIKGVDDVRRKPSEPMGLLRIRHNAGVDGEWVFVDTDVFFQKSVRRVFKVTFDIALTTRNWSHLDAAQGFSKKMPFNTGIVFSRCPRFWGEVYTRLRAMPPRLQEWMGEQQVICDVATHTERYDIRHVSGAKFNYPPRIVTGKPPKESEASILHYKGPERKQLMLKRLGQVFP